MGKGVHMNFLNKFWRGDLRAIGWFDVEITGMTHESLICMDMRSIQKMINLGNAQTKKWLAVYINWKYILNFLRMTSFVKDGISYQIVCLCAMPVENEMRGLRGNYQVWL